MTYDYLYNLLVRSLEEPLSTIEQEQLKQGLVQSVQLRHAQQQLKAIRKQLQQQQYQFKPHFTSKVLQKINQLSNQTLQSAETLFFNALYGNFKKTATISFALLAILLVYTYLGTDTFSNDPTVALNTLINDELSYYLYND